MNKKFFLCVLGYGVSIQSYDIQTQIYAAAWGFSIVTLIGGIKTYSSVLKVKKILKNYPYDQNENFHNTYAQQYTWPTSVPLTWLIPEQYAIQTAPNAASIFSATSPAVKNMNNMYRVTVLSGGISVMLIPTAFYFFKNFHT